MTISHVKEQYRPNNNIDATRRTASRAWYVFFTEKPTNAMAECLASDLLPVGSDYPDDAQLQVNGYTCTGVQGSATTYIFTINYCNPEWRLTTQSAPQYEQPPWERPLSASITRPLTKEVEITQHFPPTETQPQPCLNSAGELFDPPITTKIFFPCVQAKFAILVESSIDAKILNCYELEHYINADAFSIGRFTFPKFTAHLEEFSATPQLYYSNDTDENGNKIPVEYYEITAIIAYDPRDGGGFYDNRLNAGYNEKKTVDGVTSLVPIMIGDAQTTIPQPLNANGALLPPSQIPADVTYTKIYPYEKRSYSALSALFKQGGQS